MNEQLQRCFECPICADTIDEVRANADKKSVVMYTCNCNSFLCDVCYVIHSAVYNFCPTCRKKVDYVSIPKQKHYGLFSNMSDAVNNIAKKYSHIEQLLKSNPEIAQLSAELIGAKRHCYEVTENLKKYENDMFATMQMCETERAILETDKANLNKEKNDIISQKRNLDEFMKTIQGTIDSHQQEKKKMEQTVRDMTVKMQSTNDLFAGMKSDFEKRLAYSDSMMNKYKEYANKPNRNIEEVEKLKDELNHLRNLIMSLLNTTPNNE